MAFFPGIQLLRAVAAALVVFQHAAYIADGYSVFGRSQNYGRSGVILFFAISGFVIALQRTKPIAEFAAHRLIRIYPSYWIAILLEFMIFAAIGRQIGASPASIFLYPSPASNDFTSIPYWTLAFEMTFYILASIVFLTRPSDRNLTIACLMWIAAVHIFGRDPSSVSEYGFPGASILISSPVQVFPMGMLCAIHFKRLRHFGTATLLAVGAVAFATSIPQPDLSIAKIFWMGAAASCVVAACATFDPKSRAAFMLGDASYGIYLMHFPAMIFAAHFFSFHLIGYFLTGLALGLAFGLFDFWLYNSIRKLAIAP
jgi:peptidoglycan/LPS O-acetylase OafA/YrhL